MFHVTQPLEAMISLIWPSRVFLRHGVFLWDFSFWTTSLSSTPFTKETTGRNTRSPQHRVFPSVTAHGFTKVAALCCGPSLHSLKADPSTKPLAEIFSHMARNTLLTVLCFASAFGDLHEGIVESDIDDPSGTSEVIEPSFWMVFGDRNGRRMRNDENRLTSNQ